MRTGHLVIAQALWLRNSWSWNLPRLRFKMGHNHLAQVLWLRKLRYRGLRFPMEAGDRLPKQIARKLMKVRMWRRQSLRVVTQTRLSRPKRGGSTSR